MPNLKSYNSMKKNLSQKVNELSQLPSHLRFASAKVMSIIYRYMDFKMGVSNIL